MIQDRRFIYSHDEAVERRHRINRPWTAEEKAKAARAAPEPKPLDAFSATMIAEGVEEADEDRQIEAWQFLVDTGLAWRLQGWFGRQAAGMIKAGILKPYPRDTVQ